MLQFLSFSDRIEQRVPWRVSVTVAGVSLLSLLAIFLFGWWASSAVDREALGRETGFARQGLEDSFARIPKEQESSVIWDEAVRRVKAGDPAWMARQSRRMDGHLFRP